MCEIWRELGGLIPANIDVRLPAFDLRVRIPIPDEVPCHVDDSDDAVHAPGSGPMALHSSAYGDGREGFRILTRDRLIATVENLAAIVPDWHDLLEYRKNQGYGLELAWRRGTVLDWVTEETTVDGKPREWAVLSGIVLKQVSQPCARVKALYARRC